jgi:NAD(P)-dependent dehydrogenase (short-subunit alcohol dehydrogenase family)
MNNKVCVIIGVAQAGYTLALLARNVTLASELAAELGNAKSYECDITNTDMVSNTFARIQKELGDVEVLIYNAGSGTWGTIEEITAEQFEESWRVNAQGLLLASQQVIPAMKKRNSGSIIIIGATASRRGGIKTAAFASAKAAQRSLVESMARYLWPKGIHVALVIIDGVIDLPKTRANMPDKPDSFFLLPADIAATVHWLTQQPPSAWSFEVEARPFGETW